MKPKKEHFEFTFTVDGMEYKTKVKSMKIRKDGVDVNYKIVKISEIGEWKIREVREIEGKKVECVEETPSDTWCSNCGMLCFYYYKDCSSQMCLREERKDSKSIVFIEVKDVN